MLFKSTPDHTTAYPAYTAAMGAGGVAESHQPNYIACLVIIGLSCSCSYIDLGIDKNSFEVQGIFIVRW